MLMLRNFVQLAADIVALGSEKRFVHAKTAAVAAFSNFVAVSAHAIEHSHKLWIR